MVMIVDGSQMINRIESLIPFLSFVHVARIAGPLYTLGDPLALYVVWSVVCGLGFGLC